MPATPQTITRPKAAAQLGLHFTTVHRYVRIGKLPATQDGMVWRVRDGNVEALKGEARLLAGDNAGAWWLVDHLSHNDGMI